MLEPVEELWPALATGPPLGLDKSPERSLGGNCRRRDPNEPLGSALGNCRRRDPNEPLGSALVVLDRDEDHPERREPFRELVYAQAGHPSLQPHMSQGRMFLDQSGVAPSQGQSCSIP